MIAAPKRRWFRFSLRTLFLVVTTLAILLAVVAWKFRQDASREMALGALRNLGMQTSLTCQSADLDDRQIEPFLAQIATLKRAHDLGMSPGMDLIQLDMAKSSISSDGEHALRQALPEVEIKR
jgi:septal ring-binding cell division protein DamX